MSYRIRIEMDSRHGGLELESTKRDVNCEGRWLNGLLTGELDRASSVEKIDKLLGDVKSEILQTETSQTILLKSSGSQWERCSANPNCGDDKHNNCNQQQDVGHHLLEQAAWDEKTKQHLHNQQQQQQQELQRTDRYDTISDQTLTTEKQDCIQRDDDNSTIFHEQQQYLLRQPIATLWTSLPDSDGCRVVSSSQSHAYQNPLTMTAMIFLQIDKVRQIFDQLMLDQFELAGCFDNCWTRTVGHIETGKVRQHLDWLLKMVMESRSRLKSLDQHLGHMERYLSERLIGHQLEEQRSAIDLSQPSIEEPRGVNERPLPDTSNKRRVSSHLNYKKIRLLACQDELGASEAGAAGEQIGTVPLDWSKQVTSSPTSQQLQEKSEQQHQLFGAFYERVNKPDEQQRSRSGSYLDADLKGGFITSSPTAATTTTTATTMIPPMSPRDSLRCYNDKRLFELQPPSIEVQSAPSSLVRPLLDLPSQDRLPGHLSGQCTAGLLVASNPLDRLVKADPSSHLGADQSIGISLLSVADRNSLAALGEIQRMSFRCHVCGSGFEDRHRLQQHLSIHLNLHPSWFEEQTIKETMAEYESKRGDYLCGPCQRRFETAGEFDRHMQIHGDKPHRCELCNRQQQQQQQSQQGAKIVSFRYYRQLLTHLRSHCFLYSCRFVPDCKQTANRKDYLKLHILKHHLDNKLPEQFTISCH